MERLFQPGYEQWQNLRANRMPVQEPEKLMAPSNMSPPIVQMLESTFTNYRCEFYTFFEPPRVTRLVDLWF